MVHSINFLEEQTDQAGHPDYNRQQKHRSYKHRRSYKASFVVASVIFILVAYFIVAMLGAGRVVAASLDAKDEIQSARAFASNLEFDNAIQALGRADEDIKSAKSGLVWLYPIKVIPVVGDQVQAVVEVLDAGERLIPALVETIGIANNIVDTVQQAREVALIDIDKDAGYLELPESVRTDILKKIHQSTDKLETVHSRILLAEDDIKQLNSLNLAAPIQEVITPFLTVLPELKETIEFLIPLSVMMPEIAGLDESKQYLVLFENNTELRPGGGFIGTFGNLVVKNGSIIALTSDDSYMIDRLVEGNFKTTPPKALAEYLGVDAWYFRDSNWFANFPTSAVQAVTLLNQERVQANMPQIMFDGVIAITPTFASKLLEITGPITIDGQTFDADNIADTLEYQVEFGFQEQAIPRPQRKDIVGLLTQELISELLQLPMSDWSQVVDASLSALTEKQLIIYSFDQETQDIIAQSGWGGVLPQPADDALLVVDANMASLKTDPAVDRTITYNVRPDDNGRLVATVTILYEHNGEFDWKTTRYRTYTRVFVPEGSEFIKVSGTLLNDPLSNPSLLPDEVDIADDGMFTTFGAFTSVEPGESRELIFQYYLPDEILDTADAGFYQLDVFKQPGAANHNLTVDVDFGTPLRTASPSELTEEFGDTAYRVNTILSQDKSFIVRY